MAKRGRKPKEHDEEKKISVQEIIEGTKTEEQNESPVQILSTGIDLFDLALGGGFPLGKIVNLVGDKSSGKTLLAMEFIAYCRYKIGKKFRWFYDDAEAGFSFNTEQLYGFKMIGENQKCSFTVEEFGHTLEKQLESLRKGEILVYVLDSLDALSSKAEIDRDIERSKKIDKANEDGEDLRSIDFAGSYGMERQKLLSEMLRLRKMKIADKNCILIIISQVRMNIGIMFGEKYTRTGGKALDFYASQIIWLAEAEKMKKKDRVTGISIKARIKKNKIGKPFRECFIDAIFDYGIDNVATDAKFLFDLLTPLGKEKSGKIDFDGKEFKSLKELIVYVEKNQLQSSLKEKVYKKWNDIEESISSKERISKWVE